MLHTYIQRHENWGENLTIVIFMIPWYSSWVLIYALGGGNALCVEVGFAWTYLENEIKQFLSYFGIFHAIADSMQICFTNMFLSTQILTKTVNFEVNSIHRNFSAISRHPVDLMSDKTT